MPSKELEAVVDLLASRDRPENPTLEDSRAGYLRLMRYIGGGTEVGTTKVDANGVPAEWVAHADSRDDSAVLYLHGGGYVIGSIDTHRELAARISKSTGCRVLVIDYRLAPEAPYPAAVEDATNAYRWMLDQGVDSHRTVIAGDSAGGGLTVAAMVALRDSGDPLPASAVCLSPWVDLEGIGESMTSKAAIDPMVAREGLLHMANLYLDGADPRSPLAAPLYADLHGLPPILIQVGTWETLLSDSVRLAERAESAGVDVALEQWEEMVHVWHAFAPILPEGQEAIDRIGEFVATRMNVAASAD